ncbi:hypothetical protein [Rhizobium halophytocola]|nr:hypothetical protein [Rhizobium halophytocola]
MGLTVDELAGCPKLVPGLKLLAGQLQTRFDANPRLARYLASHQRWLMSQVGFALYLKHSTEPGHPGLTTGSLKAKILPEKIASRNTVLTFLDQLLAYRFVQVSGDPAKRPRRFEVTMVCYEAMFGWFMLNLAALDLVDGGERVAILQRRPELFKLAQPRFADAAVDDPTWRHPPRRVAMFLWTEAGGLVMDELICQVNHTVDADWLPVGRLDARTISSHFMMSRTHLQRLFRKAVDADCLRWVDERRTAVFMSRDYLAEYCRWHAVKLALVDEAFEWAIEALATDSVLRQRSAG